MGRLAGAFKRKYNILPSERQRIEGSKRGFI